MQCVILDINLTLYILNALCYSRHKFDTSHITCSVFSFVIKHMKVLIINRPTNKLPEINTVLSENKRLSQVFLFMLNDHFVKLHLSASNGFCNFAIPVTRTV